MKVTVASILLGCGFLWWAADPKPQAHTEVLPIPTAVSIPTAPLDYPPRFHNRITITVQCWSKDRGIGEIWIDGKLTFMVSGNAQRTIVLPGWHTLMMTGSCDTTAHT